MHQHNAVFAEVTRWVCLTIVAGLLFPFACLAQSNNSWTSLTNGHWEDSTWSLGIPPAANQSVLITNAGSKAVGIFLTTATDLPATMTVSNLTVSAPTNSENTLLLNFVGMAAPLQVLNNCEVGNNGSILNLSSSLWIGQNFSITTNGSYVQEGGMTVATNSFSAVAMDGGTGAVTNGVFLFADMEISDGGTFTQAGGSLSGNIEVEIDGSYNLIDGFLVLGDLSMDGFSTDAGVFNQSGGTNVVGYLSSSGTYHLTGGLLSTSNAFISSGTVGFLQSGGVHLAGGRFSCENYTLTGGTLAASNLQVFGTMAIGPGPAVVSNTVSFSLEENGTLQLTNCTVNLAPLISLGDGVIQFYGNDTLTFADSSTQVWSGSLTISNWNGSTLGGGADQLIFGGAGLTLRQLERISFVNPAGFPPGTWLATILSTGEVVPSASPTGSTQPNLWTSSGSGLWEDSTSWSLRLPPATNQTVFITNAGFKAVAISLNTALYLPDTMAVGDLFVSAPNGARNTLLLNFSGTNVPLQVINDCVVGTNGILQNLDSGLAVGGDLIISNGTFVQVDGVTGITNSFLVGGNVEVTNPALLLISRSFAVLTNASFVQEGGLTVCTNSSLGVGGVVTISDATLVLGGIGVGGNGFFSQIGGSLDAQEVFVNDGDFYFGGGTALVPRLSVSGPGPLVFGHASVGGGVLMTTNISIFNGSLAQSDGQVIVHGGVVFDGAFEDYGPSFVGEGSLSGGIMESASFGVEDVASFSQSGGTNCVSGDLGMGQIAGYELDGGLLCTSNTIVYQGNEIDTGLDTHFIQSGGVHWVTNSLSVGGLYADYSLAAGTLIASNIVVSDQSRLTVGASPGVAISNGVSFTLQGGTLELTNTVQNFGALVLLRSIIEAYALNVIDFTSSQVRFVDSSGQKWDTSAILYIEGWNGSASGGGTDQLIFGNSASGLTAEQLRQIQFESPAGFPPGTWPAKMLPTGEVVPFIQPRLTNFVSGSDFVVQWPASSGFVLQAATNAAGPYEDISNALDPFTNDTTEFPQRFFRLREQQ